MAKSSLALAIKNVMLSEGETYENDPNDPGGPTKFGITLADVRLYVKRGATWRDVRALTKETAIWVYKTKYWDALRCDELPAGLDYTVFDYGVNSGLGRSGKALRHRLGLSTSDWHVTNTVLAVVMKSDTRTLITGINADRLRFLRSLGIWASFGRGWSRRVASVDKISKQMLLAQASMYHRLPDAAYGPCKGMLPSDERSDIISLDIPSVAIGALLAIRTRRVEE